MSSADEPRRATNDYRVVLCTAPHGEFGERLARLLVDRRLAACVNLVPAVTSYYRWEGTVHRDDEVLLIAKTDEAHLEALIATIIAEHPYECPEAIALQVVAGAAPYLEWIAASLGA